MISNLVFDKTILIIKLVITHTMSDFIIPDDDILSEELLLDDSSDSLDDEEDEEEVDTDYNPAEWN